MGAAIFVDVVHSFLHAVYHLNAALQVPILCPQRLHLGWAESQIRCKSGACMDLHLRKKGTMISNNIMKQKKKYIHEIFVLS